ncbi:MAG: RNA polymerase sigma-70 factor ECF subfamily [Bacteroidetes bacterium]|nr:MAG: RNA polymerase sigma-70 factor ECF subfamily [Bacteroidota bacterium]
MKNEDDIDKPDKEKLEAAQQSALEDHEIIRKVLKGQVNAYRVLVDKYQRPVYNLLIRMIHDRDEARELTQVVFVKAYEALATVSGDHKFFSWVYRIAVNTALNYLKKQKNNVGIEYLKNVEDEREDTYDEREYQLQYAVNQLKEKYRAVIVLKYYEQLSYKEVAYSLQISEQKVRSRLFDARMQIKEILEKTPYFRTFE